MLRKLKTYFTRTEVYHGQLVVATLQSPLLFLLWVPTCSLFPPAVHPAWWLGPLSPALSPQYPASNSTEVHFHFLGTASRPWCASVHLNLLKTLAHLLKGREQHLLVQIVETRTLRGLEWFL